jgi:antitoxin (DNA-binding transcriptional repressor) of toxin-antitoxin stability system
VGKTRKPVLVTRFGKPVAQIVPPPPPERREDWFDSMKGRGQIMGDIITPASDLSDWEVLKPDRDGQ